jgi:Uri superfamily endonuclease
VVYNIQIRSNKIKLIREYENVTQKVLLFIESILHNAKQLEHERLYFAVSRLKIIGHGNSDDKLESHLYIQHTLETKTITL